MSRGLIVAIIFVGLATNACAAADAEHAPSQRAPSRHAPSRPAERQIKVAWRTDTSGKPVAVAADSRGVIVSVDRAGVAALDTRGGVVWTIDLDGVAGGVPVLVGDRVVLPIARADGTGGCLGLDRQTGETRWRYEAPTVGVAVARAGALVICVLGNGQSAGIPPNIGFPQWELTFQGDVESSTIEVPAGAAIAVDESTGVFAFVARIDGTWQLTARDIETGVTRFFLDLGPGAAPSSPALIGEGYFGVAASDRAEVDFVGVAIQKFVKVHVAAAAGFDPTGAPLRVDGLVFVAARSGEVTAIDLSTLRPRWTARSPDPIHGARPVVLGKAVMLATATGGLVAFRLADGAPVRLPPDPGRAITTFNDSGPAGLYAVGQDGQVGWIERWEPQPWP
ncbi:MAG: outer membrane protein assembly factor BamB [Actinomycetota bacterium]|jgi:outer membrane protein assembly factor BamB|nr:outer membrane protein assembly factor BamB [Actinomycetota bacterium]